MPDLELMKRHSALYKTGAKAPVVVDVGPLRFLMIDGTGPFGAQAPLFRESVEALYTLAYRVKFAAKKLDVIYKVMPLQGLYFEPSGPGAVAPPATADGAPVSWRLMIMLPDEVEGELVEETRAAAILKKGLPRLADVRVQTFSEGKSVQVLHVGPYADEPATVERLFAFAAQQRLKITGAHHEIYLSDPARTAPEKLKTLIRYGVRRGV